MPGHQYWFSEACAASTAEGSATCSATCLNTSSKAFQQHIPSTPAHLESCLTRLDWRFMVVAGALAALQASQREPPHSSIGRSPQIWCTECSAEGSESERATARPMQAVWGSPCPQVSRKGRHTQTMLAKAPFSMLSTTKHALRTKQAARGHWPSCQMTAQVWGRLCAGCHVAKWGGCALIQVVTGVPHPDEYEASTEVRRGLLAAPLLPAPPWNAPLGCSSWKTDCMPMHPPPAPWLAGWLGLAC